MNEIVKIVHQTWRTEQVPDDDYPRVWQESWKKWNPDWEYRLWTDEDNERLVRDHYRAYHDGYSRIKHGVVKSDIARALYMHRYGGIYADLDYICLRPMDDFMRVAYAILKGSDRAFCTLLVDSRPFGVWPRIMANAMMYSSPRNWSLIRLVEDGMLYFLAHPEEEDNDAEALFGSKRFNWLGKEYGRSANLAMLPARLACPYRQIHDRGDPEAFAMWRDMEWVEREFAGCYAVSSWRGGWFNSRWTKGGARPPVPDE